MKTKINIYWLVALLFVTNLSIAQVVQLDMTIPTTRSLSKLQELEDLAKNSIQITLQNLTDKDQEFILEAVMFSNETDFSILTNPDKGVTIRLAPRQSRILQYDELLDLFEGDALILADANSTSVEEFLRNDPTGAVPTGNYQLCVRLRPLELNQQLVNSLSNTACATIRFEHYAAPIVNTIKGEPCQFGCEFEELPNPNEQIVVNFTASEFNDVSGFNYQMKIFEVTSGDFNQDFSAMQGSIEPNRYLYDQPVLGFVSGNTIVEPIALENIVGEFELGKQYALVIQAKTPSGNASGIFAINNLGQITVANNASLAPGTNYPLQVEVTDNLGQKSTATIIVTSTTNNDLDADGVPNAQDLCPNTPVGTLVNAYGCPKTLVTCNAPTNAITITSTPNSPQVGQVNSYVLTDSVGIIQFISTTPSFTGLTFNKTYMAVAIGYMNDGSLAGLTVGQPLSGVTAACLDKSDAILVKPCAPINLPPVIADASFAVPYNAPNGTQVGTNLIFSDPENMPTTLSIIGGNTLGIFAVDNTGKITVVNNTNLAANQIYTLQIVVTDNVGKKDTATVTINSSNNDADQDGVIDALDQCPNTPIGTPVNSKGCPLDYGKIGNLAFYDYNGNGTKDATEPGWNTAKVKLFKNNVLVDSTITNMAGGYLFDNLGPGAYKVYIAPTQLPQDFQFTTKKVGTDSTIDSNSDALGYSNIVNLFSKANFSDSVDLTVDFGISINHWDPYGYIYCEETGEILKGGKITVNGPPGAVIYYLADGSNGYYRWATNLNGVYTMTYAHPGGQTLSSTFLARDFVPGLPTALDGSPLDKDGVLNGVISIGSKANADTTYLLDFTQAFNPYYLTGEVQIGMPWVGENNLPVHCYSGQIGSQIWVDTNNNGINDPGEPGKSGIKVYLWKTDAAGNPTVIVDSTTTDASGSYMFSNLPFGDFKIQIKPSQLPAGFTLSPNQNVGSDLKDSDVNPGTGFSDKISLSLTTLTSLNVKGQ